MAVTNIPHRPDLTKETAMEIFKRHFASKYEFIPPPPGVIRRDFAMKKSDYIGVVVTLQQAEKETKFVYSGYSPGGAVQFLVWATLGLISLLLYNNIVAEVRSFIESAPEFH